MIITNVLFLYKQPLCILVLNEHRNSNQVIEAEGKHPS